MNPARFTFLVLALGLSAACARGDDLQLLDSADDDRGSDGGARANGAGGGAASPEASGSTLATGPGAGAGDVGTSVGGAPSGAGASGPDSAGAGGADVASAGIGGGPSGSGGSGGAPGAGEGGSDAAGTGSAAAGTGGDDAGSGGAPPVLECGVGMQSCDGDPSNGCETFTSDDPDNCGTCQRSCGGGACEGGSCKPHGVLAPDPAFAYAFVGSDLVVGSKEVAQCAESNCLGARILRVPQAGGAPTEISLSWSGQGPVRSLATDGTTLYWAYRNNTNWYGHVTRVMQSPIAGGTPTVLHEYAGGFDVVTDLKLDGGELFWSVEKGSATGSELVKMTSSATPLAPTSRFVRFVLDATHVYWSEWVSGSTFAIRRVSRAGGAVTTLIASYVSGRGQLATDIAVDDDYLYYHSTSGLYRASKVDGSSSQQLAAHAGERFAIELDATRLYYGTPEGLRTIPKVGGTSSLIATCGGVDSIRSHEGFIYFTCNGGGFPYLHRVRFGP